MSMATSSSNKASTSKNQIPSSTSSSSNADASAAASPSSAKGFLAGVASGLVKCSVGHPFDSVSSSDGIEWSHCDWKSEKEQSGSNVSFFVHSVLSKG